MLYVYRYTGIYSDMVGQALPSDTFACFHFMDNARCMVLLATISSDLVFVDYLIVTYVYLKISKTAFLDMGFDGLMQLLC